MKRNLILAIVFAVGVGGALPVNAQLGKLKVKTPKVKSPIKNPIKKSSTSSSSTSEAGREAATTKRIENETAELLEVVKAMFASKEATNQHSNKEIEDALFRVKSKISTLKNYYKMSQRVDDFQADYDKYKKMADAEFALREGVDDIRYSLESQNTMATKAMGEFPVSSFAGGSGITYASFVKNKEAYEKGGKPEAELDNWIANVEKYFSTTVPNNAAAVKEYYVKTACSSAFEESKWQNAPESGIKRIDFQLENVEKMYPKVKDAGWIDELKRDLNAQKSKLETYISSGEFDKYKAAKRKKLVDGRRMEKPYKKDASMEALVKKYHTTEEYGTLKRIVITSDWYVKKNDLGIPLEKKMRLQVATTQDGECTMREGYLFKTYEGGGTYGKIKLSHYFSPLEINCDNIFK